MSTRPKLTMEEHEQLAIRLNEIQAELGGIYLWVSHSYGTSKKGTRLAQRAELGVSNLKSEMEEELFRDHPDDAATDVYYSRSMERPDWLKEKLP